MFPCSAPLISQICKKVVDNYETLFDELKAIVPNDSITTARQYILTKLGLATTAHESNTDPSPESKN